MFDMTQPLDNMVLIITTVILVILWVMGALLIKKQPKKMEK